jgi:hypothetical protein
MPIRVVLLQIIYHNAISITSIPSPQQRTSIAMPRIMSYLSVVSPLFNTLRLYHSAWPIFLLGIPQFAGFNQRVRPRPGADGQVFSLLDVAQLFAVIHAAV